MQKQKQKKILPGENREQLGVVSSEARMVAEDAWMILEVDFNFVLMYKLRLMQGQTSKHTLVSVVTVNIF